MAAFSEAEYRERVQRVSAGMEASDTLTDCRFPMLRSAFLDAGPNRGREHNERGRWAAKTPENCFR